MPGIDFDRLRAEVPMQQVLQLLGFVPCRRRGDQWYGPCPLPGCATSPRPHFSVNVAFGRFYCHRCRQHGHQIQLWAAATGLTLYPAAIHLCGALGRDVPWIHGRRSPPSR
jgi:DNA primase